MILTEKDNSKLWDFIYNKLDLDKHLAYLVTKLNILQLFHVSVSEEYKNDLQRRNLDYKSELTRIARKDWNNNKSFILEFFINDLGIETLENYFIGVLFNINKVKVLQSLVFEKVVLSGSIGWGCNDDMNKLIEEINENNLLNQTIEVKNKEFNENKPIEQWEKKCYFFLN